MTANLTIETFPNEAAADYIRGKAVADPTHFGNLPPQLKQRAFTVAGIEQLDALQRIRDAVAKLPDGASWDEAKKEIASEISPFVGGDDDSKRTTASKARAEFLLRTHGFQAYAVARHQQQMSVARDFPYWKYETVGDARVRPGHAALDGKVLRADDDWWKTHYPPWDWGCRCIVIAIDEEDAEAIGITEPEDMPTPGRSGSFTFDPTNVAIDFDMLHDAYRSEEKQADWKIFATKCRQVTVQANGREPETMWELMLDGKIQKTALEKARLSDADGKERSVVFDFLTGKTLKEKDGTGVEVDATIPKGVTGGTLHTHTNGDTRPSPLDIFSGFGEKGDFDSRSRVEYIAAGKKLRRWQWLKIPEPADAKRLEVFLAQYEKREINIDDWWQFLKELVRGGYIKMEDLT